jgi:hypothetical protein
MQAVRRFLVVSVAIGMATAAGIYVGQFAQKQSASALNIPIPIPTASAAIITKPTVINASLVINGEITAAEKGKIISLPDGAKFQVSLQSTHDGVVELYAINPLGNGSKQPIWHGHVNAGSKKNTPTLRLTGTRGEEKMRVVFHPYQPQQGGVLASAETTINVLHF